MGGVNVIPRRFPDYCRCAPNTRHHPCAERHILPV